MELLKNKQVAANKALPWWVIFEIQGETIDLVREFPEPGSSIDIDCKNWESTVWEPLCDHITKNYAKSACLVAVEVMFTNAEGNERSQVVFFKWCPDAGVPLRTKMLIGSSFKACKQKLDVQGATPEVGQRSDLVLNTFAEAAKLKGWVPK